MKAMIFAAGLGTRLKPFTDKHPKALAEVNGKTLLEHTIRYLQQYDIYDVVVNVHHFADQIEKVLEDNKGFSSNITISDERDEVLETGGGLLKAAEHFRNEEAFVVMNVDVFTTLQLDKLIHAHKNSSAVATLAVMQRDSSRHLLFNDFTQLCGWRNNKTGEEKISFDSEVKQPLAFSGIQVLSPKILDMPFEGKFSIIDVYLHFAKDHLVNGYDHTGDTFLDVGKPESLEKASKQFPSPDYEGQKKGGSKLIIAHFSLIVIALLNAFSGQLWGISLHVFPAMIIKILVLITGVLLFLIYRKPFRKRALYFFIYPLITVSSLVGGAVGGIGGALLLTIGYVFFLEDTDVKLRGNDELVVYDKFNGFLGPCCFYDLYQNRFILFQKHIASFRLDMGPGMEQAELKAISDTAYLSLPVRIYSTEEKESVTVDSTLKFLIR